MRKFALHVAVAGVLMACTAGAALAQWGTPQAQSPQVQAQSTTPPPQQQGTSRIENFSAKPAPQLFASDCTGAGCHKGPQGLAKDRGQSGLASFLREHYTNSRESAASLAAYLVGVPGRGGAAGREAATRRRRAPRMLRNRPRMRRAPSASRRPAKPAIKPSRRRQPSRRADGRRACTRAGSCGSAAPEPPAPPPEPPKPQWDIFD